MEEWYLFNEDKIKLISLVTASLVLIVSIYRWLIIRWRNDVDLRKYAYFIPLKSRYLNSSEELIIEVPECQQIQLELESESGVSETLFNGPAPAGQLKIPLEMSEKKSGDYLIIMYCDDQKAIRKVIWSGLDSVQ